MPAAATTLERTAAAAPARHVVLTSSFRPIRAAVGKVSASGDYLLSTRQNSFYVHGLAPIVINDRLGTKTALEASCDADALGPPWVLLSCPQSANPYGPYDVELYSLTDGTRHTVTLSPGMPYCSSPPYDPEVVCGPGPVGAYWIEWVASSYHHLPTTVYFQNIQTGELRADPTNATTFADLNSPALARKTCPGVELVFKPYPVGTGWDSLTPYGQYALAISAAGAAFLERCGTSIRQLLASGTPVASNPHTIVWQATPRRLTGLFLPSLQTFTIPLPSAIVRPAGSSEDVSVSALALTSSALYVRDWWTQTLWRTASPSALPVNARQPTLTRAGNILTCRRGSWRRASRFSYTWRVNGTALNGNRKPALALDRGRNRRNVSCSVTAHNASGATTAVSAAVHVR